MNIEIFLDPNNKYFSAGAPDVSSDDGAVLSVSSEQSEGVISLISKLSNFSPKVIICHSMSVKKKT